MVNLRNFWKGSVVAKQNCHNTKAPPLFFLIMRLNIKVSLIILCCVVLLFVTFWSRCNDTSKEWRKKIDSRDGPGGGEVPGVDEIECDINGEYNIGCRREGDEVYLPFSFIHKYFEIYGKLATYDGVEKFEWSHSYGKIYHPKGRYDPRGVFMYFENYNVEVRERVKCVSATEGVPISTQWESQGYYYPTQIAQFGLSHYSKNLTEPEPRRKVLENADKDLGKWQVPDGSTLSRIFQPGSDANRVVKFVTSDVVSDGIKLKLDHVLDFVMSVDIMLKYNSSFSVILQNRENKDVYNLHYIVSDILITTQDKNIYHGLGTSVSWQKLTRDLIVDLYKGLNFLEKTKHKLPRSKIKVISIILQGQGFIDNLTLSSSEHIRQFYDAANWFVKYQNKNTGGWSNSVKRKIATGFQDLNPGWYSAMGQGHALSVLSRAYFHSGGDKSYLDAALGGLKPFRVPSWQGGVLATFFNKFRWYEEYPTKPASFVLNGFIYSLLGLYDLMTIAPANQVNEAQLLFEEGMNSLKNMLLLFDMGSVTSYDLRHVTLGVAPNLARWDYHATHVNQLLLLSTIDNDLLFSETAERWIGYMNGKRAAHN